MRTLYDMRRHYYLYFISFQLLYLEKHIIQLTLSDLTRVDRQNIVILIYTSQCLGNNTADSPHLLALSTHLKVTPISLIGLRTQNVLHLAGVGLSYLSDEQVDEVYSLQIYQQVFNILSKCLGIDIVEKVEV